MRSYIPDVNLWIALAYTRHLHNSVANQWWEGVVSDRVFFCRFTQLGFLRLLTNGRVMDDEVKTQREAWRLYDDWRLDERIDFLAEPPEVEAVFRELTQGAQPATRAWPDAYLAAVARAAGLTLVTLDYGFRGMRALDLVILGKPS